MKPNTSLMRTVLVAVLLGMTVASRADNGQPASTAKPKPGAAEATAKEEPKIDGIVIPRKKGGFLGLKLENSNFRLTFYDEKKLPVAVDVSRAAVRWVVHYTVFDEHAVLTPTSDGMALTSEKFVRPPYAFKLFLTLIVDGSNEQPENYVVDFHQ